MTITLFLLLLIGLGAFLPFLLPRLALPSKTVVQEPVLGFINVAGRSCQATAEEDRDRLAPLFERSWSSHGKIEPCDVFFLYCEIADDGGIVGMDRGLRELIRDRGAKVAVVANGHMDEYLEKKFGKRTGYGHANLVLTLDRKGERFGDFFYRLFTKMFEGTSMPIAWHELAPQVPGQDATVLPECICLMEMGQLAFSRRPQAENPPKGYRSH